VYGPESSPVTDTVQPMQERADVSDVASMIYDAMVARQASFSLTDALRLPPVVRSVQLICSTAAQFLPVAYRGAFPLAVQPRIASKPDPFHSRYEFIYQSTYALLTEGETFWRIADRDSDGNVRSAFVLPNADVAVQWDDRRFLPRYTWRGQDLILDRDIKHVAIGRPAGELHGVSPLKQALPYLAPIAAAEDYALGFFESGGVPEVVLKAASKLSPTEAAEIKARWVASRLSRGPEPFVHGNDIEPDFPGIDPQKAQMQESRAYGRTIVASLLGIPAALLHVETSGATITYQNPAGAIDELVKGCVAPTYLAPLEQAWSELVPSTQSIRFNLNELQRADIGTRVTTYKTAIDAGLLDPEQAASFEGWVAPTQATPTPSPADATPVEVPA
jgi:HK97 family phage portal protein